MYDNDGNIKTALQVIQNALTHGGLKETGLEVRHPTFGPIFNVNRADDQGVDMDAKETRRTVTEEVLRVAQSKNKFNHIRMLLAGSLYSWSSSQAFLREQNIGLNETYLPAIRLFILVMIARLFFWAAGSSSHADSFEYRVFCLKEREQTIQPCRWRIFWIGEQLLRLAHSEKTVKSSQYVTEDVLESCSQSAERIIEGLDTAHHMATQVVRRGVVVKALFDLYVWNQVVELSEQPRERVEAMMSMFVSADDFAVAVSIFKNVFLFLFVTSVDILTIYKFHIFLLFVDCWFQSQAEEGKIGRHSQQEGTTEVPANYGTDAATAPVATTEGGIVSLNGTNAHVRLPVRVDTHIKKDSGVVLQHQIRDVLSSVFLYCGLFFNIFACCGDHARSNRSQLEAVDAYLSFPLPFQLVRQKKDTASALENLEKEVREESRKEESVFDKSSNVQELLTFDAGQTLIFNLGSELVWFFVKHFLLPSPSLVPVEWQRCHWINYLNVSVISKEFLLRFNTFFKLDAHNLADSSTHSTLREQYDGQRLGETTLGSVFESVDATLVKLHQVHSFDIFSEISTFYIDTDLILFSFSFFFSFFF